MPLPDSVRRFEASLLVLTTLDRGEWDILRPLCLLLLLRLRSEDFDGQYPMSGPDEMEDKDEGEVK